MSAARSAATVRLTMAQALMRFLDNQYVEVDGAETKFVTGVAGIFGHGNVVGLGEALAAGANAPSGGGHSLRYFQGHNEQGAAHMAIGYAKQSNRRRIFAVTSTSASPIGVAPPASPVPEPRGTTGRPCSAAIRRHAAMCSVLRGKGMPMRSMPQ